MRSNARSSLLSTTLYATCGKITSTVSPCVYPRTMHLNFLASCKQRVEKQDRLSIRRHVMVRITAHTHQASNHLLSPMHRWGLLLCVASVCSTQSAPLSRAGLPPGQGRCSRWRLLRQRVRRLRAGTQVDALAAWSLDASTAYS